MKRVLYILAAILALTTFDIHISVPIPEAQIGGSNTFSTLDIPQNYLIHNYSSKEFTTPSNSRTIERSGTAISITASYVPLKRTNNISSISTNKDLKVGFHKYISYGILRI